MIIKMFRKMVDAEPLTPMSTIGVEIAREFQIATDSQRREREDEGLATERISNLDERQWIL